MYWPAPLAYLTERLRIAGAARMLRRAGCKKMVLYIWRPEFADSLKISPQDLSVYHIDDEYSFSTVDLPQDPAEAALIRAVDRVIIHSPALMEKKDPSIPIRAGSPTGSTSICFPGKRLLRRNWLEFPAPSWDIRGPSKNNPTSSCFIAAGVECWIQALEQSLQLKTDALAKARQAEAKRYDWDILTHPIPIQCRLPIEAA
jgi:hypothetical protein